jgi:hypothetical protein
MLDDQRGLRAFNPSSTQFGSACHACKVDASLTAADRKCSAAPEKNLNGIQCITFGCQPHSSLLLHTTCVSTKSTRFLVLAFIQAFCELGR